MGVGPAQVVFRHSRCKIHVLQTSLVATWLVALILSWLGEIKAACPLNRKWPGVGYGLKELVYKSIANFWCVFCKNWACVTSLASLLPSMTMMTTEALRRCRPLCTARTWVLFWNHSTTFEFRLGFWVRLSFCVYQTLISTVTKLTKPHTVLIRYTTVS